MPEYHVTWEIELNADSPRDAAAKALAIQRDDPDSIATVFDVTDKTGITEQIDLAEIVEEESKTACKRDIDDVQTINLTQSDWTEIYYAVELKRLSVAEDNRQNGRHADGVDLAAWRRQMEHIKEALGPDGERIHEAITTLIQSADRVASRWGETDLQFAVQDLDRALAPFGFGTRCSGKENTMPKTPLPKSVIDARAGLIPASDYEPESMKHSFVGVDSQRNPCIYVGRLEPDGGFNGNYLSLEELETLVEQLNRRKGWSDARERAST
jgi:hypothetical protein